MSAKTEKKIRKLIRKSPNLLIPFRGHGAKSFTMGAFNRFKTWIKGLPHKERGEILEGL